MVFLLLLLASLVGAVVAVVLTVRGVRGLDRRLRGIALLAAAGAVAVYTWGLLHVTYAVLRAEDGGTGSSPVEPCRKAGSQRADHVIGYGVSYVPLDVTCHLSDGGSYRASSVPGWVNPAAGVLALTSAATGIAASTRTRAHTG
ncbi:hypothetical protein [Asanoa siamensis]|uniref:Integral membrane protein n=1 Tax=Asanoa siamensis TaxID=926357 RepID=A0ABQ4CZN5_9ACTN|nr:hypothetical protein [Asanoa siamensis]GIF76756.1 hypothetical protein Asi02nite_62740 [Asanoa siamensis]